MTNLAGDSSLPTGTIIQAIYANGGIPLPFSRYVCDWQKFKASDGHGMVFDTF